MSKGSNWSGFDFSSLASTKVLVTGGAGFIGSHLAIALDSIAAKVTVLDDLCGGGNPAALPSGVEFVKGSILDQPLVEKCTAGRAFVFHQAALGSVPRSVEQPRLFHDVNVTGTLNVLEAARKAGVKRVMFAASSSAYGDSPTLPKIESMPAIPRSPYAANKVACEAMLSAYAASYSLDTVNLRYFNIFGPRQSPDNAYAAVIAAFAKALLKGQHPQIYGDGEQSRDFTYVDNVVLANLLAARSETPLHGIVLNVACGQRVTVTELAKEMASLLGRADLTPIYKEERAGDVKHSLADLSLTVKTLGYRPIVAFKEGLAKTVKWYASVLPRS
jgi:nucleoside-diphosphate-sugar epimerase